MMEFGEKVKQIREERGMTQQTLADKLYVTRQAVSRWERGARYPELLTAKKIAIILDVSLDELLSGEELEVSIGKKPIPARPIENIVQTILYTVVIIAYLLLCMLDAYSFLQSNEAFGNMNTMTTISSYVIRFIYLIAATIGLILSVRNKLTAKITGYIMCIPYFWSFLFAIIMYIDIRINDNGHMGIFELFIDCTISLIFALCILLFFVLKKCRVPLTIIMGISIFTVVHMGYIYKLMFVHFNDMNFAQSTIQMIGGISMYALLGYQAYVWDRKRQGACARLLISNE